MIIIHIHAAHRRPMARYVKHPRFKGQKMDNFKVAIDAMESIYNTKIIGISAAGTSGPLTLFLYHLRLLLDLVEGNAKQTMGLVFLLASHVSKSKKHDGAHTSSLSLISPTQCPVQRSSEQRATQVCCPWKRRDRYTRRAAPPRHGVRASPLVS